MTTIQQFSKADYGIRTTSWHFFGQDAWKVRPRFTLNLVCATNTTPLFKIPTNEILGFFPGQAIHEVSWCTQGHPLSQVTPEHPIVP